MGILRSVRALAPRRSRSYSARETLAIVVAGVLVAALLPRGVEAAGNLVTLVDADSTSQAQVDAGKLRVGDGSGALTVDGAVKVSDASGPLTVDGAVRVSDAGGPLTVDGTTNATPVGILAAGDCDTNDADGESSKATIPSTATITAILMGPEDQNYTYASGKLTITAPGSSKPMISLVVSPPGSGFTGESNKYVPFDPPLRVPVASQSWNLECPYKYVGDGLARWVVLGRP